MPLLAFLSVVLPVPLHAGLVAGRTRPQLLDRLLAGSHVGEPGVAAETILDRFTRADECLLEGGETLRQGRVGAGSRNRHTALVVPGELLLMFVHPVLVGGLVRLGEMHGGAGGVVVAGTRDGVG